MNPALRFLLMVLVHHSRCAFGRLVVVGWALWRLPLDLLRLALQPSVVNRILWAAAFGVAAYAVSLWLLVLQ